MCQQKHNQKSHPVPEQHCNIFPDKLLGDKVWLRCTQKYQAESKLPFQLEKQSDDGGTVDLRHKYCRLRSEPEKLREGFNKYGYTYELENNVKVPKSQASACLDLVSGECYT